jgi:polysaccharide export outer membrane protein
MKLESLALAVFLASALFCQAQDKPPAEQPAPPSQVKPAAPEMAKPAAPEAVEPAPASQEAADNYVIGESDVISVTVLKETTLSGGLLVRPDGMIAMPLVGEIKAAGKTPAQLADIITAKLRKYIQDPNVTVVLSQINSKKVYLMGEVMKTGPVEMTPGMTLLEAIASAGGLTQYANSKKIYILRSESGAHQKIPVQYKKALGGDSSLNLTLKPGDTIVVP